MESNFPLSTFSLTPGIFESMPQETPFGFSLMNSDYIIEFTNDTLLKIVRKNKEEVVGRKIFDVFPEAVDELLTIFESTKTTNEPFAVPEFRITIKRNLPGFGIGLYIVKDIMERHEGKMWVESEKNKGSKFYFSLPVGKNITKI